jgi:hypothetical protein
MEFTEIFASVAALSAAVISLTQFLKIRFNLKDLIAQLLSILIAFGFSFLGWWLELGMFVDLTVFEVIFTALSVAFFNNGLFKFGKNLFQFRV